MEKIKHKENSGQTLAIILIAVGMIWILSKTGITFRLHTIISDMAFSLRNLIPSFVFSWPMILIIIGLILMAGKRNSGIAFIVIGGILLLPKIFLFPSLAGSFLVPAILVGIGIAMLFKHINQKN